MSNDYDSGGGLLGGCLGIIIGLAIILFIIALIIAAIIIFFSVFMMIAGICGAVWGGGTALVNYIKSFWVNVVKSNQKVTT